MRKFAPSSAAAVIASVVAVTAAHGESFNLRIASGHAPALTYVKNMSTFFVPEVKRRVAERTNHTINFLEAYGGSIVKVAETLEGVQDRIVNLGGYCFCFEPANLFLQNYQYRLPFGIQKPTTAIAVTREVYDQIPELSGAFEDRYNQVLINLMVADTYHLYTTFPWQTVSDLEGRKISGAGPNLPWFDPVGAVPVGTTLPEVYPSLQTGIYDGITLFASTGWSHKLYEPAPYFTLIGFGAMTLWGLTINKDTLEELPGEVRDIIFEVGREFERKSGIDNERLEAFSIGKMVQNGAIVRKLDPKVRENWARALADWPNEMAKETDSRGWPGSRTMNTHIVEAEKAGHEWPVRYEIR